MKTTITNIVLFIFVCGLFNLALANDLVIKTKGDLPTVPHLEFTNKVVAKDNAVKTSKALAWYICVSPRLEDTSTPDPSKAVPKTCYDSPNKITRISKK
jgi:hypothetical protein